MRGAPEGTSSRERADASWRAFLGAYLGWVFDYFEVFFLSIVIVPIAREFNWTTAQTSTLLSVQLAAIAIGGILWGYLADRFGRRLALQLCIAQYSIFTFARAFVSTYELMFLFTTLAGIGIGGEYGVGQSLVTETVGKERRGAWSSMLYSGIFIGIMLAALAGGLLLPAFGWRVALLIASAPVLLVIYVRRGVPESQIWAERKGRGGHLVPLSAYLSPTFLKPFALCLVTGVAQFYAYYGTTSLMPTYLVNVANFSLSRASWWVFLTAVAGLAGATGPAYIIDRLGRRATLCLSALVGVLRAALVYFFWPLLGSLAIVAPFFLLYAGFGATASVFGSLFSEIFPTAMRATGMSAALQIGRGTTFAAPLIAGALYPTIGYQPLIIGAGLLILLDALLAWAFPETARTEVNY